MVVMLLPLKLISVEAPITTPVKAALPAMVTLTVMVIATVQMPHNLRLILEEADLAIPVLPVKRGPGVRIND